MNRLQGLSVDTQYLVTLNSKKPIAPERSLAEFDYTHPNFTVASMKSQSGIRELSGNNRTSFAGSYLRFGFHEDAVMSGVWAAESLGVTW